VIHLPHLRSYLERHPQPELPVKREVLESVLAELTAARAAEVAAATPPLTLRPAATPR
jgi:hypothetical protein